MAESILIRVKRVVMGGVGDMVDAMETAQGESVLREALREVDRAIDDARGEVGRIASKRMLASRQAGMIRARASEFTEKARIALAEGRSDIAEALISRQVDLEAQIPVIEGAERDAQAEETELAQCLSALQARKREMEADLEAFVAARRLATSDSAPADGRENGSGRRRAEQATAAFDRVMKNSGGVAGAAPPDRETASKIAEFDGLLRQRKIEERLKALQVAS